MDASFATRGDQPGPKSIFVVDDDVDIRVTLSQILEEEGYRVETASNGLEALARLRNAPAPDLILLDLMMPTMNGWEFLSEKNKDPRLGEIPVVVLTATGKADPATESAAEAYVTKPVALETLLETIARHVSRASEAVGPAATPNRSRSSSAS